MEISTSKAYSSSSNPETLIEDAKADTPSTIVRPMGQKTAKRKSKGKGVGTSTNTVDLTSVEEAMRERNVVNTKLAVLREKELKKEYYDILMKDTLQCLRLNSNTMKPFNIDSMNDIMLACIILHNMIVKDERDTFNDNVDVDYDHVKNDISNVEVFHDTPPDFVTYLQRRCVMHTRTIHQQLQADLVEHI
ncbi:hypothetical protein HKD37_18G051710 [Glycine soja]